MVGKDLYTQQSSQLLRDNMPEKVLAPAWRSAAACGAALLTHVLLPCQVEVDPAVKLSIDFPSATLHSTDELWPPVPQPAGSEEQQPQQQPQQPQGEGMECVKRQYQPSNLVRKRRHGFLARSAALQRASRLHTKYLLTRVSLLAGSGAEAAGLCWADVRSKGAGSPQLET